jgi:alkyl hydroperoxide reductase subunit AhpC
MKKKTLGTISASFSCQMSEALRLLSQLLVTNHKSKSCQSKWQPHNQTCFHPHTFYSLAQLVSFSVLLGKYILGSYGQTGA